MASPENENTLMIQYEKLMDERLYFDNLLWTHLWRFFMIEGVLLGVAFSNFVSDMARIFLLILSTVWAYISTASFAKCYLWIRILVSMLESIEKELGMIHPPRRTEELYRMLGRQSLFLLPFQGISTPRMTFWALFISSIVLLIVTLELTLIQASIYFALSKDFIASVRTVVVTLVILLNFLFVYLKATKK